MSTSPFNWYSKHIKNSNQICPYCERYIGENSKLASNKEHLIGRKFVFSGTFEKSQNLIFRACIECNTKKSDYERHVSSITTLLSINENSTKEEINEVQNKISHDIHPEKKISVANSHNTFSFQQKLSNGELKFSLISPPRLIEDYAYNLAIMQIQGLYSFIASKDRYHVKTLNPRNIGIIGYWPKSDWGNTSCKFVINFTKEWTIISDICTAEGNFKFIIRQKEDKTLCFWAFEWNKSYRILGILGNEEKIQPFLNMIPKPKFILVKKDKYETIYLRQEESLHPEEDFLFTS